MPPSYSISAPSLPPNRQKEIPATVIVHFTSKTGLLFSFFYEKGLFSFVFLGFIFYVFAYFFGLFTYANWHIAYFLAPILSRMDGTGEWGR
jgi:lipoprotein signal peptidase